MIEIIVLLEIKDHDSFKEFEGKAIDIMKNYNGKLLSAFDLNKSESSFPDIGEVHIFQFPDIQSYKNYRTDPQLMGMSELRNKAISSSKIMISNNFKLYE